MRIGVLLSARFTDAGDYLADARALDAAGVDSLWLPDDGFDPWLVLAGIATVTGRARLAISVSARDADASDALARRRDTLDRLSRGRVLTAVVAAGEPTGTEALIARVRRGGPGPVLLEALGGGHAVVGARLADGLVAGIGRVNGDLFDETRSRCAVLSYDYTVLAGTQGLQNHRKKDRLFELAADWLDALLRRRGPDRRGRGPRAAR